MARPALAPLPRLFAVSLLLLSIASAAWAGVSPPTFGKAFSSSTIGPGAVSTLTFTISNSNVGVQATDLAFSDVLPAGVAIATPSSVATTCIDGVVVAPDGGSTITFSGGTVPGPGSCTVTVNVTSAVVGTHSNLSGDLTSDLGNSGPAAANLTVAANYPGFSKSFAPASVGFGGRSTLTLTIDNTINPSQTFSLAFTDNLPSGIVIADPSNASTTCTSGVVSAPAGGSTIGFSQGVLNAGEVCTISVDVTGVSTGVHVNTSGDLASTIGGPSRSGGKATAALTVTAGTILFSKAFTDDPVSPGGTVELEFTLRNLDRFDDATAIGFTDDLDATLSGLVATGLPAANVCGPGSSLTGTSVLTLTGGNLAADGGSCTFSVTLQVPAGAAAGGYPNTTSALSASLGGSPFMGPPATETLFVSEAPTLTKTFLTNPVGAGDMVTMRFMLTNNSTTSSVTAISFLDSLDDFLNPVTIASLPAAGFCGAGSTIFLTTILSELNLSVNNANLPAAGSCTFDVVLTIPAGTPGGAYVNTTGIVTATVGGVTQFGRPASDTLVVAAGPSLQKEFTDDPVLPGGTVTLELTLEHAESAAADATGITFTDDLAATLSGLTAIGLPANDVCGTGSVLSGTTLLTLTGGTLMPGETCTFSVSLQVPAAAVPGSYVNTTSSVMATVGGVPTTTAGRSDTLLVAGLSLAKSFTDDPVVPGGTVTLEFTIDNTSSTSDATGIAFSDNLATALSGLAAVGLPLMNVCGAGSQIAGTTNLSFTGGNLLAGTSCTFSVTLQVPGGAADGVYVNLTSSLSATIGGSPATLPAASDALVVSSELLLLTKTFTDDPVPPGGTVTLEFTIDNLDATQPATGITFTDDLDAALAGLVAVGLPVSNVCGAGSQISGTGLLILTGGDLPAGGSCTFSVTLQVPAAVPSGTITNTTSAVSGTIGGLPVSGIPASDVLEVSLVSFSKSFDGPTVAGGTAVLSFSIANESTSSTVADLSFLDDLDAVISGLVAVGLPQSDTCGLGSVVSGTSVVTLNGGNLLPSGTCTIQVTVQVPVGVAAGSYPNTTSDLFLSGSSVAAPATADLVIEPPPGFSKAFAPGSISPNGLSTLTFTIDNTASAIAASALDFTDNLPAGMTVAMPSGASTTCTGGTLTATPGTGVVGYTGGTVAAGASCTVQVDVVATTAGQLLNTSGDLTSSSGDSGPASATLAVVETLSFSKQFLSAPVLPGGTVQLEYTISNPSGFAGAIAIAFSDDLGAVIPGLAAVGLPANDVCGVGSQVSGTGVVSLTGGNLAAGGSCTFAVTVQVPGNAPLGTVTSTSGAIGFSPAPPLPPSSLQGGTAAADLEIAFLGFTKAFDSGVFQGGATLGLTFTISNPDPVNGATAIGFSDDLGAALTGLVATGLPLSNVCGAGSQISGTSVLTLTGGSLAGGASCMFTVTVQIPAGAAEGTYTNTTGALGATAGSSTVTGGTASAQLVVLGSLTFSKSFVTAPVLPGGVVELEYTIGNPSAFAGVIGVAFSDDLGAVIPGLAAVGLPASNVCGAGSQLAGAGVVSLTGGNLAAGGSCTFSVMVQVPANAPPGTVTSTSGAIGFSPAPPLPPASLVGGTAAADLVIEFLSFSKEFEVGPFQAGAVVGLTFVITNPDPANAASGITFTDDLDAVLTGLVAVDTPLADVCGSGSQLAGTALLTLTGGTLAPGESCVFEVMVQIPNGALAGTYTNVTSVLEATVGGSAVVGGPATVASADLEVSFSAIVVPTLDRVGLLVLIGLLAAVAMRRLRVG